ncbi:MAG: cytochrome c peroxidase [Methylococcaceae bacterium]|nr:cytochrome c peroxidase [Methylococcaceae bacterium]
MKQKFIMTYVALPLALCSGNVEVKAESGLTYQQLLGKALFFDTHLSTPRGQACASCHGPSVGWTGPDQAINAQGSVYEGAVPGRFGNRKPPSAAYAPLSPVFHIDATEFVGGNFWDGRATGEKLGNPAADQAQGPFLNPLEQNNASAKAVCEKVRHSNFARHLSGHSYRKLFHKAYGKGSLDCEQDAAGTYDRIALAIAAFEASREVSQFSSKYDVYLKGKAELTDQESHGLVLFEGKAHCSSCHTSQPSPEGKPPLFTDNRFNNLGVPKNPENPFYRAATDYNPLGESWVDPGLGGFLAARADYAHEAFANEGKQRVPTLRNVDKRPDKSFVKAYMHNGVFKSLKEVVHFYNTRDVLPRCESSSNPIPGVSCWPAPEVEANLNQKELGNLALSSKEEDELVAFLKTLTDGFSNEDGDPEDEHPKHHR